MNDIYVDDAADDTDAWLVEAGRQIDEPDSDVERLISSISAGLGRTRRPARALATDSPGIRVTDRIVKQLIAIRIRRELGRLAVFASVDGEGEDIDGVRVGLIARYADDLREMSDRVRDVVDTVLFDTVGENASAAARRNISVRWQDVYTREWL
ncbi:hypothetical protein AAFP35_11240 [Gordonia sp. CPCC 206044]|uniref:hypothetical protein n=1 Tax=Gordonia sp. CPCC 206044 TaxID=3140793 RepID=UPI003AF3FD69